MMEFFDVGMVFNGIDVESFIWLVSIIVGNIDDVDVVDFIIGRIDVLNIAWWIDLLDAYQKQCVVILESSTVKTTQNTCQKYQS